MHEPHKWKTNKNGLKRCLRSTPFVYLLKSIFWSSQRVSCHRIPIFPLYFFIHLLFFQISYLLDWTLIEAHLTQLDSCFAARTETDSKLVDCCMPPSSSSSSSATPPPTSSSSPSTAMTAGAVTCTRVQHAHAHATRTK